MYTTTIVQYSTRPAYAGASGQVAVETRSSGEERLPLGLWQCALEERTPLVLNTPRHRGKRDAPARPSPRKALLARANGIPENHHAKPRRSTPCASGWRACPVRVGGSVDQTFCYHVSTHTTALPGADLCLAPATRMKGRDMPRAASSNFRSESFIHTVQAYQGRPLPRGATPPLAPRRQHVSPLTASLSRLDLKRSFRFSRLKYSATTPRSVLSTDTDPLQY